MAFTADKTFINLPVKDLKKTMDFFSQLGFEFNSQYTDKNAACMIINENTYAMLLVEPFFQSFIKKELVDPMKSTGVIIALSADSREQVDALVNKALSNGGSPANEPQEYDFMYSWSFHDIDGNNWEVMYMEENAIEQSLEEKN